MNEGSVLLQDIRANPADDGLRLIYADWLEDNGQVERAEFIRVQIAFTKLSALDRDCRGKSWGCYPTARCYGCRARDRENELIDSHGYYWVNTPQVWPVSMTLGGKNTVTFRRGFVAEWKMRMQAWLDHGKAIYAAHPIERVEITDREPRASIASPGEFLWDDFGDYPADSSCLPDDLPAVIWRLLTGGRVNREGRSHWHRYSSKKEATDALSRACLAYAKQLTQSPTVEV